MVESEAKEKAQIIINQQLNLINSKIEETVYKQVDAKTKAKIKEYEKLKQDTYKIIYEKSRELASAEAKKLNCEYKKSLDSLVEKLKLENESMKLKLSLIQKKHSISVSFWFQKTKLWRKF